MLKCTRTIAAAAALAWIGAGPAVAGNLDLDELAAALAFPVITGGQPGNPLKDTTGDVIIPAQTAATLITISNGSADDVLLKLDLISGDRDDGDSWQSTSFDCELTGRETTTLVFYPTSPGNSRVYVECSANGNPQADPRERPTGLQNGILFVAVADPDSREVVSEDVIFGDAIVADTDGGQAYSFSAIPFQAGTGQNDGNKVYEFDGAEYAPFPSVLAVNFIAPSIELTAELILFTLDGAVGNLPVPRVKLGGFGYNDDEVAFDFSYEFDCFDVVALDDVNPNLRFHDGQSVGLGSISGHLQLVPQVIASGGFDVHDAIHGDGNNSRRRGVHGWIVQSAFDPGDARLLPGGEPIPSAPPITVVDSPAAWGRPLAQSTTALIPFQDDRPAVLDADTLN